MKPKHIRVTVSQTLNVGNFENIKPETSITAELEDGDEVDEAIRQLWQMAAKSWSRQALLELAWVAKGRTGDKKHEYNQVTQGTRARIKDMIS